MYVNSGCSLNTSGALINPGQKVKPEIIKQMGEERVKILVKAKVLIEKSPVLNEKKDGEMAQKKIEYKKPEGEGSDKKK